LRESERMSAALCCQREPNRLVKPRRFLLKETMNTYSPWKLSPVILFLYFVAALGTTFGEIEITLKNAFIDKFQDRATIDASFTVDKAHKHPNPAKKDGDLHIAGRAPEVELATVAEIMNAASQPAAVTAVHQAESSHQPIAVTGAWRLWCEHGGDDKQTQGEALQPFDTTNPPHVFQIHPITKLKTASLVSSVHSVTGYVPKEADNAFLSYERIKCQMRVNADTTTLITTMAGNNYVKFVFKPTGAPDQLEDGTAVFGHVYSLDGELLLRKLRVIFIKGSTPEKALNSLASTEALQVLGMPRISLKLIAWRRNQATAKPEVLAWSLPYEMIAVGTYGKIAHED